MAKLFEEITLGGNKFKNRIVVSPMCQYSATEGVPNDWHLVHLGSRAVGGAALIIAEASGVNAEGRISPADTGIWNKQQAQAWARIVNFIHSQNALAGIQLAHAGRKASTGSPWENQKILTPQDSGWVPVAPSAVAFDKLSPTPRAMTLDDIHKVQSDFENSTRLALEAGFDVIEIHAAHGYLLHEFLSPLSNFRKDEFGGSLENRMRFLLNVTQKVRALVPSSKTLFVRISASDWMEGGWDLEQSIILCTKLKELGVDLIDVSSGGLVSHAKIEVGPGYQVQFSADIKKWSKIATGAVGMISTAEQAESILQESQADIILLAREMLRDPYWALRAAKKLGVEVPTPKQYRSAL